MTEVVVVDIGGTHVRFAVAEIANGRAASLGEACTLKTGGYSGLKAAWEDFAHMVGRPLPRATAIAVASPTQGDVLELTNSSWTIRPSRIPGELGVERVALVNDFGAVAHAVAQLDDSHFRHLCGPDTSLSEKPVVSIVGPGTGLGVAQLIRSGSGYQAVETEGGHIDFAPLDAFEDRLLARLRRQYGRVSVERVASGKGLANIYELLADIDRSHGEDSDDKALWTAALAGEDRLARAALDRFCSVLGATAGNIALAQGAHAVVIAGGIGLRLADHLPRSGFRDRFIAKGRFGRMMEDIPVKVITHPQPGLIGAAAAFAAQFGS